MVEILSKLFQNLGTIEIDKVCYLVLGLVAPQFEDINLGLSEKTVQSAISLASGATKSEVEVETRNLGDIGEVTSNSSNNKKSI